MTYQRSASLETKIDTDTGEFNMVMATEGEASDGHIIAIRGLEVPTELPLQLDHGRGAVSNLGVVSDMTQDTADGVPIMRGRGRIRLTGDGEALAARRDLVDAIARGDLRGVSLSWDATKATERRDLPRDHSAHVPRGEKDPRKRFGLYFEKSRAIEQSLVGIPADREALIGRAEAAEDDVSRAMWNTLVSRFDDAPRSRELEIIDALEGKVVDLEERLQRAASLAESDLPADPPVLEAVLRDLRSHVGDWRGRTQGELDDALGDLFLELTGRALNE